MKSELLRKALMSKMVNGGNVGDGGKKDDKKKQQAAAKSALTGTASGAPIDDVNNAVSFFTEKQMSPQEWATYAEKQGWKPFHAESEIPVDQQIKMNKYIQYYDPRQYARTETGFVKLGDVGKGVDYSRDTTYKPNIQYGLTKPTNSVPPTQTATQDSLKFQFLPRIKLYGSQKEQYDLFKSDPETYKKRIEEYSRLKSDWEKKNEGMTGGLSGTPRYIKGYTEPKTSTADPLQAKKKGGVVGKYQDGGTASAGARATYNVGKSAGNAGGKASGMGGGFDVSKLSPELLGQAGELAGTGLDILDRRDERSSIAGQTGVGALKGAGKGAAMLAPLGPIGMIGGAIGGAVIGGAMGASRGKKEKKERLADISEQSTQSAIAAQEYDPLNPNAQPQGVKVHKNDVKGGLAGLFANGGQVKQMSNSANKINYAKGGTIKGAGTGTSDSIVADISEEGIPNKSFVVPAKNNKMAKGIRGMVLGDNPNKVAEFKKGGTPKSDKVAVSNGEHLFTPAEKEKIIKYLGKEILEKLAPEAEENEMEKNKGGEMIKRADGSYSKRGLWDNIRANIGSGKKPTPEMLKQEKEIKSELSKGGYVVKRSSERKGKTHVVIGPDGTKKYFGDSKLGQHPNDPARKKAFYARHEKNLKKNPYFRAFARETWAEGGTVGSKMNKAKGGELTKSKAKEILHDKSVHGKPLTDKQRKYFGWVAGGKKNMGGIVGKYAMGGNVNRDWDWG